jgi:hypothetical protein
MSVEPTSYDRKLNLAYAAGLFDGEGCITYKNTKKRKAVVFMIVGEFLWKLQ